MKRLPRPLWQQIVGDIGMYADDLLLLLPIRPLRRAIYARHVRELEILVESLQSDDSAGPLIPRHKETSVTPSFTTLRATLLLILPGVSAYAVPQDMEEHAQTLVARATRSGGPYLVPLADADADQRQTALRNLLGHTGETYRQMLAAGPLAPVANPVRRKGWQRPGPGRAPTQNPRCHAVTIKLNDAEFAEYQRRAQDRGLALSALGRLLFGFSE